MMWFCADCYFYGRFARDRSLRPSLLWRGVRDGCTLCVGGVRERVYQQQASSRKLYDVAVSALIWPWILFNLIARDLQFGKPPSVVGRNF